MEKLWLDENNETEFVFNKDKLKDIEEKIAVNKQIIDEYQKKYGSKIIDKIEKDQSVLNVVTAVGLEDENAREKFPPVSENIESQEKVVARGFLSAQNLMFIQLEKEPFIYCELLEHLHRELTKESIDISQYAKGKLRDPWANVIQTGYFTPTPGSEVKTEMNLALSNYAYVDRKGKDDVFEKIAKLHAQMVRIQPFMDGNKRMSFLVTNAMLRLHGLPIIDLCNTPEESREYNSALKEAIVVRDVTHLAEIFANKVYAKQEGIINAITVEEVTKELTIVPEKIK